MSLREKYSVVVSTRATAAEGAVPVATAAARRGSVHEIEASESASWDRTDAGVADPTDTSVGSASADAAAPLDAEVVLSSSSTPRERSSGEFSARQELEAGGCAPRARFWKHAGFDPALCRAADAMNLDSPARAPASDNTAYASNSLLQHSFAFTEAFCTGLLLSRCCLSSAAAGHACMRYSFTNVMFSEMRAHHRADDI